MSSERILMHFLELKKRLVFSLLTFLVLFLLAYNFSSYIYWMLMYPLQLVKRDSEVQRFIFTGMTEAFFTKVKLSMFAAMFLTIPIAAFQLYQFIAPGLFRRERKVAVLYLVFSPILFTLGGALAYFYVMPMAWEFFLSFEMERTASNFALQLEPRISEYLELVIAVILGFGIAFQLPLVLILLCQIGLLQVQSLRRCRRHAIVAIFLVAAMLTPPDVISQIVLAIPLILLYEISILLCSKYLSRSKNA